MTRDKPYWTLQQQNPDSCGQAAWQVMLVGSDDHSSLVKAEFSGLGAFYRAIDFLKSNAHPELEPS